MPTDPALCKRLAERVMGWQYAGYVKRYGVYLVPNDRLMEHIEWHPDTDIAQAMLVAEQIGYLTLYQGDKGKSKWLAYFNVKTYNCSGEGDTPALAISLAADAWLKQRGEI